MSLIERLRQLLYKQQNKKRKQHLKKAFFSFLPVLLKSSKLIHVFYTTNEARETDKRWKTDRQMDTGIERQMSLPFHFPSLLSPFLPFLSPQLLTPPQTRQPLLTTTSSLCFSTFAILTHDYTHKYFFLIYSHKWDHTMYVSLISFNYLV